MRNDIRTILLGWAFGSLLFHPASAADEFTIARSRISTVAAPCANSDAAERWSDCKSGVLASLAREAEAALQSALAKASPQIAPLLKRDQVWFRESLEQFASPSMPAEDDDQTQIAQSLRDRIAMLKAISGGFQRSGIAGAWRSAFWSLFGAVFAQPGCASQVTGHRPLCLLQT